MERMVALLLSLLLFVIMLLVVRVTIDIAAAMI
jgi:hypothetical protein